MKIYCIDKLNLQEYIKHDNGFQLQVNFIEIRLDFQRLKFKNSNGEYFPNTNHLFIYRCFELLLFVICHG